MNHTDTVRLRAMEPEDLDLLYTIENDTRLWAVGVTSVPYSRYVLHDYIANTKNDIYADGQVRMMIETTEGETVGIADIMNFDPKNNKAEMGLVIQSNQRRKGYAVAAVRQIESYAAEVLHLHQLYVVIADTNMGALTLFRQIGYNEAARLPQWLYDGKNYADALLLQTFL
jgi:diamine N-acetyltransferase